MRAICISKRLIPILSLRSRLEGIASFFYYPTLVTGRPKHLDYHFWPRDRNDSTEIHIFIGDYKYGYGLKICVDEKQSMDAGPLKTGDDCSRARQY